MRVGGGKNRLRHRGQDRPVDSDPPSDADRAVSRLRSSADDGRLRFVDLFCGIGGFSRAVFDVFPNAVCAGAYDADDGVVSVYSDNYNHPAQTRNVLTLQASELKGCDLLCAGLPCQPFSSANKKRRENAHESYNLASKVAKLITEALPGAVLIEEVPPFLKDEQWTSVLLPALLRAGYTVSAEVLNAAYFGVPQRRKRAYIFAALQFSTPLDLRALSAATEVTVCISDVVSRPEEVPDAEWLPDDEWVCCEPITKNGATLVGFLRDAIEKRKNRQDRFYKVYDALGVAPTLTATGSRLNVAFSVNGKLRARNLRVDELYAIMGFPRTFIRHTTKTTAKTHAGNAVVPAVAAAVLRMAAAHGFGKGAEPP